MRNKLNMTKLALLWCTCALALTPAPRSHLPRRLGSSFSDDDLQRPAGHGYTRGPGEDDGFVDIPTVDLLLTQRNEAKRRRDFVVADAIRDELKVEHNVGVHDRDRTWWLGRQQRQARPQRPPLPSDHGYAREIGDNTPLVLSLIHI